MTDRSKTQEAGKPYKFLQAEYLEDFVTNASVPLHWVGRDGTVLWANQAELDLLGYAPQEYIGHPITEFHADPEVIQDILERLSRNETLSNYEARLRAKDGSIKHVLINSNVYCEDGEFVHTRCFTRDMTDRKRVEEALRESEERHRRMIEQSPLSVQILAPDGRTIQVNQAWQRLWGIKLEMLHDYNILEDPQLEEKGILPYIRKAFAGEAAEIPAIHYYPDRGEYKGQPRWVRAFIYPVIVDGVIKEVVLTHEDITERQKAEQELALSEQRHRAIFENAKDAILLADSQGRYIDVNPAASTLTGYSKQELLGLGVEDLTPPEFASHFQESWASFLEEGAMSGEYAIMRKDGSRATVQFRALANVLPGLNVSILQDVSDTRQAERALKESEARFRELADSMPAIVWSNSPGGKTDFLNRWYYEYTGLSTDIPGEEGWQMVVHPDDRASSRANYTKCFQSGTEWIQELRLKRADGVYRWHLSRSVPVRDSTGKIHRWFATSTDIHDQKEAEAKARDEALALEIVNRVGQSLSSELELDRLVQALTDAATQLVGAQFGSFFYNVLNAEGEAYMLYTLSGVPRSAFERFPMPRNTAIFDPTFQGDGVVRSDDITKDPRYGQNPPYNGMPEGHLPVRSYLAVPVVSRAGDVIGGLFFGHSDVGVFNERHERTLLGIASQAAVAIDNARLYTRLSNMNTELEQRVKDRTGELQAANREMEGFTYSVSHDLRGPLRAIMSTSMILQEDYASLLPDEAKEQLQRQAQAAKKLGDLIDDLLRLSRLGRQEMAVGEVDLSTMALELTDELRGRENCDSIEFKIDPGLRARVDSKLVRLVLVNLFDNACKFSPQGGTITFGITSTDRGEAFYVKDEGIGFDMKYQQKMFLAFERLVLDTEFPGTGIGLANVKRIVERHGGQVWAEGALGQGATFYFTLP